MTLNQGVLLFVVILVPVGAVFVAVGTHLAIGQVLSLLDGHLERFQGKLDVLVVAQTEHNAKLDAILRKLF